MPAHQISRVGVYRTFQNLALWHGMTVIENVMVGDHTNTKANFFTAAFRLGTRNEEKDLRRRAWKRSKSWAWRSTPITRPPAFPSAR